MNINIICVGKLKEKYLKLMEEEYSTRLSKFIKLNIIEIREEDLKNEDEASINIVKIEEGKRIIETIKKIKDVNKEIYMLAINGKEYDTLGLKDEINKSMLSGKSSLIFIIGGSYGLSDEVLNLSRKHISFSKLTFPHQLFRCILLEQIYRVYKIINNEPYHK